MASVRLHRGHTVWDTCGVCFAEVDDSGTIISISVRHNMFPNVDMVAFPKRDRNGQDNNGSVTE